MPHSSIFVINSGSSSLKFSLFSIPADEPDASADSNAQKADSAGTLATIASGQAERLNSKEASLSGHIQGKPFTQTLARPCHQGAMEALIELLQQRQALELPLMGIGHRVVHGGEYFRESVIVDSEVLQTLEKCQPLAPLHNPANILGIKTLSALFPEVPQVAVFDTAFHQSMPPKAYLYPLPYAYYRKLGVRRYGFHGTSVRYVAAKALERWSSKTRSSKAGASKTEPPEKGALDRDRHGILVAHLGNGCSVTAVKNGQSVDTSMGMTPLEGLVMGTRCGDIDPSLHQFLAEQLGLDLADITAILNRQSGLQGLSELSNDMRTLCEAAAQGHEQAQIAIEVFCYRLARQLCALAMPLGKVDALVFTGGIGEHAAIVRAKVVKQLSLLGLSLDLERNDSHGAQSQGLISPAGTGPLVGVITCNEELMIARDTLAKVSAPIQ